jgi:hypothetical protein
MGARMVRDRADQRRLNPIRAVADGLASIPLAARAAWGILAFWTLMLAAPLVVPMEGAVSTLHGLGLWATGLVAVGALLRLGVGQDMEGARALGLGAAGLQVGAAELRIVWAAVLIAIFLGLIGVVLGLMTLAVFGIAELNAAAIQARDWSAVGPVWKQAALAIFTLGIVAVPVLLLTRLSLFAAASVARRRTVSLDSMAIATGSGWPLFGLLLVLAAGPVILGLVILKGVIPAAVAGGLTAILLPWVWAPFAAGSLCGAYRQLEYWTPDAAADKHYRDLR